MTVGELVEKLKEFPWDWPVLIYDLDYLALEELEMVRLGEDDTVVILEAKS